METIQSKSFEVAYKSSLLVPIWDQGSLWFCQKDICKLFSIESEELFSEAENIFSLKIFGRKENIAYFEIAGQRKMYFRVGFLLSLWYRLHKQEAAKFVIKINRLIKNKCDKQKLIDDQNKKATMTQEHSSLLGKVLYFGKTLSSKSNKVTN